ncbi:transcriptional regulator with XRE-family HTH domain [Saccharothrix ecbatanensis]|uniref:Transcriptional regulator with XRE-family HTH domain n=1 Tax=Saccharothrix ecbatanensis TaxID=1105145 RepID=A0A7W9HFM1_9PSEU|nr:transcriptional regulator with XRE-family HTH domain [Saccharothrix ecbatanensis]
MAERVGVTTACLLRWERRQRTPSPEAMAALASVLRLSVQQTAAFFVEGPEHPGVDDTLPGRGLRTLRRNLGVPTRRIADALGVTVRTVYHWEKGGTRLPVRLLAPLAECLGTKPDDLVEALRESTGGAPAPLRPNGELARLRQRAGYSQVQVAALLDVSRTTLRGWERGEVVPPWQAIRLMASFYRVPLAALAALAKAGTPSFLDPGTWLPGELPELLRVLRQWNGLTQAQVGEHCGTSSATVRGWERARQRPQPSQQRRLECLYHLPPDSLTHAYAASPPISGHANRDAC